MPPTTPTTIVYGRDFVPGVPAYGVGEARVIHALQVAAKAVVAHDPSLTAPTVRVASAEALSESPSQRLGHGVEALFLTGTIDGSKERVGAALTFQQTYARDARYAVPFVALQGETHLDGFIPQPVCLTPSAMQLFESASPPSPPQQQPQATVDTGASQSESASQPPAAAPEAAPAATSSEAAAPTETSETAAATTTQQPSEASTEAAPAAAADAPATTTEVTSTPATPIFLEPAKPEARHEVILVFIGAQLSHGWIHIPGTIPGEYRPATERDLRGSVIADAYDSLLSCLSRVSPTMSASVMNVLGIITPGRRFVLQGISGDVELAMLDKLPAADTATLLQTAFASRLPLVPLAPQLAKGL